MAIHIPTQTVLECATAGCTECREKVKQAHVVVGRSEVRLHEPAPRFVCGTRAVERRGPGDFRVVCATCGAGGTVKHATMDEATHAAVRDSNKPCRACGAA